MLHALLNGDAILRYEDHADVPPPNLAPEKGLRWLPVIDIRPVPAAGETLNEPEITVAADRVLRAWTVRPITPAEQLLEVQAARRAAYPAIGEQLDAAFKARAGDPSAQAAIDGQIAAVKAAHPKPAA